MTTREALRREAVYRFEAQGWSPGTAMKAAWAIHPMMDGRDVSRILRTTLQQRSRRFAASVEDLSEAEAMKESRAALSDYAAIAADAGEVEHQAVYARLAHY